MKKKRSNENNDMTPSFPMPIMTERLIIRPTKIDDAPLYFQAITESFDQLHRFMDWAIKLPSMKEQIGYAKMAAQNWFDKKNEEPYLQLIILDKKNDFIGATGFHHYNWSIPSVEIGYWIRKKYSGRGLMTEAINAITQYAFKQLKVNRIALTCDADNFKSKHVAERLHFALEGKLKNHRRKPDTKELSDTLVYARYDLLNLPELQVSW